MPRLSTLAFAIILLAGQAFGAAAEGKVMERTVTYAISGSNGPELYDSIGARGPKLGRNRVIAHTGFKLTWERTFTHDGDACVLSSAIPDLLITTTLPKPSARLDPDIMPKWQAFLSGVTAHEKIHAGFIRDLVGAVEAASIGLRVENDPACRKIDGVLAEKLKPIAAANRARHKAFDEAEMSDGGNVHTLILTLVSGY